MLPPVRVASTVHRWQQKTAVAASSRVIADIYALELQTNFDSRAGFSSYRMPTDSTLTKHYTHILTKRKVNQGKSLTSVNSSRA